MKTFWSIAKVSSCLIFMAIFPFSIPAANAANPPVSGKVCISCPFGSCAVIVGVWYNSGNQKPQSFRLVASQKQTLYFENFAFIRAEAKPSQTWLFGYNVHWSNTVPIEPNDTVVIKGAAGTAYYQIEKGTCN